jgi:hypothetical protein
MMIENVHLSQRSTSLPRQNVFQQNSASHRLSGSNGNAMFAVRSNADLEVEEESSAGGSSQWQLVPLP